LSSKVNRRSFLKYVGTGLVAVTVTGAGYLLYTKRPGFPSNGRMTIPKGWESASSYLTSTATSSLVSSTVVTTSVPQAEWWKNAKVVTACVDYWSPTGRQYVEDASIEVIDRYGGNLLNMTPALGWRKYWKSDIDEIHSKGLAVTAYEGLFYTCKGDFILKDGEIYKKIDYENVFGEADGQVVEYPLKALYESPYWDLYFPNRWRNPDGSVMADPIEDGCAKTIQNKLAGWPEPWGMISMSIHNPHYLDYVKKCLEMDVDAGFDGVQIDCVDGTSFALWQGGDFSAWAEHRLKEYLSDAYTREELSRMGIKNIQEFSLRRYILGKGYRNRINVDDPVMRAWSNFEFETYDRFVSAVYNHVKSYSEAKGRSDFAVTGNKCPIDSPFAIISNRYSDVTWFEHVGIPDIRLTLLVRQAWALSHSKPVWLHFVGETAEIGERIRHDRADLLAMMFAQVYSLGGVYLADRVYLAGSVENSLPMGPATSKVIASYCRFVRQNKAYFVDARPCRSAIAIGRSLPSKMMGHYWSLGVDRAAEWDAGLVGISHVLEREHVPHDFIILGHSRYWDESKVSSELSDRDVFILSNAEVMSEEQVQAIRSFVEKGGRLLSFGAIATRDEEYNLRRTPALADLTQPDLKAVGEGKTLHISGNPGYQYWRHVIEDRKQDPSSYRGIRDAVASLLEGPPTVETNAPDTVFISVLQQEGRSLQIHIVNLDYDERDDSVREKDGIKIRLKLPSGFLTDGKEGKLLTPDMDGYSGSLEFSPVDGYVELEVPHLRIYSIATIYDPKYFA